MEYKKLMKLTKDELARMLLAENPAISNQTGAVKAIAEACATKDKEHFVVVTLSAANKIINTHIVSAGVVNRTMVHPREVFRTAIVDRATAIIVGHNHPSGNMEPSREDGEIKDRLKSAADIIGIQLLDFVIVSGIAYLSYAEKKIL